MWLSWLKQRVKSKFSTAGRKRRRIAPQRRRSVRLSIEALEERTLLDASQTLGNIADALHTFGNTVNVYHDANAFSKTPNLQNLLKLAGSEGNLIGNVANYIPGTSTKIIGEAINVRGDLLNLAAAGKPSEAISALGALAGDVNGLAGGPAVVTDFLGGIHDSIDLVNAFRDSDFTAGLGAASNLAGDVLGIIGDFLGGSSDNKDVVNLQLNDASPISSYANVGFQQNEVAVLYAQVNGQPDTNLGGLTALVYWGDGQSSQGDLVDMGSVGTSFGMAEEYLVKGSHTYQNPNNDPASSPAPITVYVLGPNGSSTINQTSSATVAPMPSGISGTPPNPVAPPYGPQNVQLQVSSAGSISSYAGVGFQENEAAVLYAQVNGQPDSTLSDFTAQINWGDSASWDKGDLVDMGPVGTSFGMAEEYLVKGSHIYQKTNNDPTQTPDPIVVYVNGPDGTSTSGQTATATVAPMPSGISGTTPNPTTPPYGPQNVRYELGSVGSVSSYAGVGFQQNEVGVLYAQVNGQPDNTLNDFTAQINWGDSASWDTSDLVDMGPVGTSLGMAEEYLIKGSHIYQNPNSNPTQTPDPIAVYVNGPDGTSTSGQTATATVSPMPSGISGAPPKQITPSSTPQNVKFQLGDAGSISSDAGVGFQQNEVAVLYAQVNGQPDSALSDFTAQINWGDSNSWDESDLVDMGAVGTSLGMAEEYLIKGSHIYQNANSNPTASPNPIVVYVNGPDGTSTSGQTATATVSPNPNPPGTTAAGAKIGIYSNGSWYLDTDGNGAWDPASDTSISNFGFAGAIPVVGNWGPNGTADIGVYSNGTWYLNTDGTGVWKGNGNGGVQYNFGMAGSTPVVGNWGPNGSTGIGVYDNGTWYLNTDGTGVWKGNGNGNVLYNFGFGGATPVVGNWGPHGAADIGVYANGAWYLNTDGTGVWKGNGNGGVQYNFGFAGATPVVGNWGPSGAADIGVYSNGAWYLNTDGTGVWNGNGNGSVEYKFGFTGAIPIVGNWQSPPLPVGNSSAQIKHDAPATKASAAASAPLQDQILAAYDQIATQIKPKDQQGA